MTVTMHERLRGLASRYAIDEGLILGLDIGIASIGSAVVEKNGEDGRILFAGSRCFEAAEEPKTREPKNTTRRSKRLLRRVIRRRRQRMAELRHLFVAYGLLVTADPEALHHRSATKEPGEGSPDPWQTRAEGLDRRLTEDELAASLLHIAKHRGFKSNRKSDKGSNAPDDSSKMLAAIESNKALLQGYRTVGEMVCKNNRFEARKRNTSGDYSHTLNRDDLHYEATRLFADQRRMGNVRATPELEATYLAIAFRQKPVGDSEHMVGMCPFLPEEKRTARRAPSFERFRYLAKLNTVRIREVDGSLRRLTAGELAAAEQDFGVGAKSVTWKALTRKIGLAKGATFEGIDEKTEKRDVATAQGCAAGTKALHDALGPSGWRHLLGHPEKLDAIAAVFSFRDDMGSIEAGLSDIGLEPTILAALIEAARQGAFSDFTKAGHISAEAARRLLPHLRQGHVYSQACTLEGFDHSVTRRVEIDDIGSAVVRRSLREAVKQTETLIHHFGRMPGRIVIELGRDIGRSPEERDEMKRGIDKRTAEKERHRAELKEQCGLVDTPKEEDLRRFELWKEQGYRCIYTDRLISPDELLSAAVEVDHALPRSRSQDNSYPNQVLCMAQANQEKGQRTPWEWKGESDPAWWEAFEARVTALKVKPYKKRLLRMRGFDERKQGFIERNLNDTRYAGRALLAVLRELYADQGEPHPASEGFLGNERRRLFARPGQVTAILRRAWGLDRLKDRADDRHHALDAMVCAAGGDERLLHRLTREYQALEQEHRSRWTPPVREPWEGFRAEATSAYETVFVARSERRRGRGEGHAATIYALGEEDGRKVTYERKAVNKLTSADLERIKDADGGNRPLVAALGDWIARGKPADDPPRSAKGDVIRKVSLKRKGISGFVLNGGHVDNGDMVRVDVFAKPNRKGQDEFYLVPVYRHQVMNKEKWPEPPNKAIVAYKAEVQWVGVDASFAFRFSLHSDSYIVCVKRDGVVVEGYYRSTDRSTGAISLSLANQREPMIRGIGVKTLKSLQKLSIDRLANKSEVKQEPRTWHGAVCT